MMALLIAFDPAAIDFALALGMGTVFSLGRMAQGAHFLSHNVWTLLIDWLICLAGYRWLLYRVPAAPMLANDEVSLSIQRT